MYCVVSLTKKSDDCSGITMDWFILCVWFCLVKAWWKRERKKKAVCFPHLAYSLSIWLIFSFLPHNSLSHMHTTLSSISHTQDFCQVIFRLFTTIRRAACCTVNISRSIHHKSSMPPLLAAEQNENCRFLSQKERKKERQEKKVKSAVWFLSNS